MARQKKPKSQSKKISITRPIDWYKILDEVSKTEMPITVLESIAVNLKDGTTVFVDIRSLLEEGHDPREIQNRLNEKLSALDDYILDADFVVDIDAVAKTVQEHTDKLLKKL